MTLRLSAALALIAALLAPAARRAGAQDVKALGAAAAGAPSGDAQQAAAAPEAAAPQAAVPQAAAAPVAPEKAPAARGKKSGKAKKKAPVESKYKTRALSENSDSHYRFDADGNPIVGEKKKPASKIKKRSSEESEGKSACTEDAPCADKKSSDADAL